MTKFPWRPVAKSLWWGTWSNRVLATTRVTSATRATKMTMKRIQSSKRVSVPKIGSFSPQRDLRRTTSWIWSTTTRSCSFTSIGRSLRVGRWVDWVKRMAPWFLERAKPMSSLMWREACHECSSQPMVSSLTHFRIKMRWEVDYEGIWRSDITIFNFTGFKSF